MNHKERNTKITLFYLMIGIICTLPILVLLNGLFSKPEPSEQFLAVVLIGIYFCSYIFIVVRNTKTKVILIIFESIS